MEGGFRESKNEKCIKPKRNYKEDVIKVPQDFSESSPCDSAPSFLSPSLLPPFPPFSSYSSWCSPPITLAGVWPKNGHVTKF